MTTISTDSDAGNINPGRCGSTPANYESAVRERVGIGVGRGDVGGTDNVGRVIGGGLRRGSLEQKRAIAGAAALLDWPVRELVPQPSPEALAATEVTHAEPIYDGIMSYCTPRERWFGPSDDRMIQALRGH